MLNKLLENIRGIIGFASLFFFLSAQAGFLPPPSSPFPAAESPFAANSNNVIQRPLAYFTTLVIDGDMDVVVKTGVDRAQITVIGDPADVNHIDISNVKIQQGNDTLTISGGQQWFSKDKPLQVEISTKYLNELYLKNYHGNFQATNLNTPYFNANLDNDGSVLLSGKIGLHNLIVSGSGRTQIHGIDSKSMQVEMKGNPTVDLTGVSSLELLRAEGKGRLRLYWVNSERLMIRQVGQTHVELAGVANFVDLETADHAFFNGRYLRVKNGYVKTLDKSTADIQFLALQSVLASGDSHINFYGKPPFRSNFMAQNGAVLDMEDH